MIIEELHGSIEIFQTAGDKRVKEKVVLDRERMSRPHQKVTSEAGETFALSLPPGEQLYPGAVIYADEDRLVYIAAAAEDALVVRPQNTMQWARAAYNIGNMHQPAFLQEDCILVPYDQILEGILQRLAIPCAREHRSIDGLRASVSQVAPHHHHGEHGHHHGEHGQGYGAAHTHSHDAAHSAGHDMGEEEAGMHHVRAHEHPHDAAHAPGRGDCGSTGGAR